VTTLLTANDVANYFLVHVDEDSGDNISNLKLQKLVYYAQGFHLALFNRRLFRDRIEAWEHGPVVPSLYQKYKKYGAGAIPPPKRGINFAKFNKPVRALLKEVDEVFGQYSAWKLRNLTHEEPPWQKAHPNGTISPATMKAYFKTLLASS